MKVADKLKAKREKLDLLKKLQMFHKNMQDSNEANAMLQKIFDIEEELSECIVM